jgi:pectinesterase
MTTRLALLAQSVLLALMATPASAKDATRVVTVGNAKQYQTVQAAIDALPETGGTVEIYGGTHREKLVIAKPNVKLVGRSQGNKPENVVLVWGDSHLSAGGTGKSASVWASGDGFEAHNLTIQNDYHLKNIERSQAVALRLTADRAIIENVRLLGAQDTLYAASKSPDSPSRQYFRDCYIEGHVDFIFGDAKAYFDRCHIHGIANDVVMITAQSKVKPEQDSAYVFDRCRITADAGVGELWLGRAWRPYATVVFIRTRIDAPLQPAGWREWTPGTTETFKTATYREYESTGQGANIPAREPSSRQLTKAELKQWSLKKFLAGADGWHP